MFADLLHHIKLDILEFPCWCCCFFLFPAGTFYCKFLTIQYKIKKKRNLHAKKTTTKTLNENNYNLQLILFLMITASISKNAYLKKYGNVWLDTM